MPLDKSMSGLRWDDDFLLYMSNIIFSYGLINSMKKPCLHTSKLRCIDFMYSSSWLLKYKPTSIEIVFRLYTSDKI